MANDPSSNDKTGAQQTPTLPIPTDAEAFSIVYRPERQPQRRVRYERRDDADGWWRIEAVWTGCTWRITGREPIVDVVVD